MPTNMHDDLVKTSIQSFVSKFIARVHDCIIKLITFIQEIHYINNSSENCWRQNTKPTLTGPEGRGAQ